MAGLDRKRYGKLKLRNEMPYCQGSKSANQVWDRESSLGLDREGRYGKLFLKKKCRTVGDQVLVLAGKEGTANYF